MKLNPMDKESVKKRSIREQANPLLSVVKTPLNLYTRTTSQQPTGRVQHRYIYSQQCPLALLSLRGCLAYTVNFYQCKGVSVFSIINRKVRKWGGEVLKVLLVSNMVTDPVSSCLHRVPTHTEDLFTSTWVLLGYVAYNPLTGWRVCVAVSTKYRLS